VFITIIITPSKCRPTLNLQQRQKFFTEGNEDNEGKSGRGSWHIQGLRPSLPSLSSAKKLLSEGYPELDSAFVKRLRPNHDRHNDRHEDDASGH
jgi:hypothetical protein